MPTFACMKPMHLLVLSTFVLLNTQLSSQNAPPDSNVIRQDIQLNSSGFHLRS